MQAEKKKKHAQLVIDVGPKPKKKLTVLASIDQSGERIYGPEGSWVSEYVIPVAPQADASQVEQEALETIVPNDSAFERQEASA